MTPGLEESSLAQAARSAEGPFGGDLGVARLMKASLRWQSLGKGTVLACPNYSR